MKVLVVGSGGREHALADSLSKSRKISKVFVTNGNDGMRNVARIHETKTFKDIYQLVLDNHIDFVVVGPEQYLHDGLTDYLEERGINVVGPNKKAAQIETSKVFAKHFMHKHNIPTAHFAAFSRYEDAAAHISDLSYPVVIKADGLAAGKGVIIAENEDQAYAALQKMLLARDFDNAGNRVVIEEFLSGFEASLFAFTDGSNYKMTILSHDYKRIYDNDRGDNTGGMGAYAPVNISPDQLEEIGKSIFDPLIKGFKEESIEYKGILYAGLIFTETGVKVLEFNCRLGDPETQSVLPLLKTDFTDVCEAIISGKVDRLELEWEDSSAVTIVAASDGYPHKYRSGMEVIIDETIFLDNSLKVFFSNVRYDDIGRLISSGGRVFSLTALAPTISEARSKAYENIKKINFANSYYRHDIAKL